MVSRGHQIVFEEWEGIEMSKRTFFLFSLFFGGEGFLSPQKQKDEQMKEP